MQAAAMAVEVQNAALLLLQCVIYFAAMGALLRFRAQFGIGVLTVALGTMHFLETYLAGAFYVATPLGVMSPGSSVLFSGKLMILLLIYIKEDAAAVRQPIYGILAGNMLTLGLALLLRLHHVHVFTPDALPQTDFIAMIGLLMVWGTALLFVDSFAVILLYERLGRRLRHALPLRIFVSLAVVLAFDQAGFYLALRHVAGVPIEAFYAGLAGKMTAAAIFTVLAAGYLRFVERRPLRVAAPLGDVFQALTYRERFEELADHLARDRTTLLGSARSFTAALEQAFARGSAPYEPATLLLIEVDSHVFADIEGRLGREDSEALLRSVARAIEEVMHDRDEAFRLGPRQFALICRCPPRMARKVMERLGQALAKRSAGYGADVTVSVGGSGGLGGLSGSDVFALAERELELARRAGGGAIRIGDPAQPPAVTAAARAAADPVP
jgi:diguanylate cyclase (GGDEF)-like protein